jgi:hypothetical protein
LVLVEEEPLFKAYPELIRGLIPVFNFLFPVVVVVVERDKVLRHLPVMASVVGLVVEHRDG